MRKNKDLAVAKKRRRNDLLIDEANECLTTVDKIELEHLLKWVERYEFVYGEIKLPDTDINDYLNRYK